jgi:uncharacterized membrane protein
MEVVGWYAIVPLALTALVTGLVISLSTPWGLLRHYWVLISFGLTVFAFAILLVHMPTVSSVATVAREADENRVAELGGDVLHPVVGLALLLLIAGLNVYKPLGLTPYGWRKQREEARKRQMQHAMQRT